MRYLILSFILALSVDVFNALADEKQRVNESWQKAILAAVDSFHDDGG